MALIFAKTANDKCLILGNRQVLIYPFSAGQWTDLRLGMYLSVTDANDNDLITGLAENVTKVNYADRITLGFVDNATSGSQVVAGLMGEEAANRGENSYCVLGGAGSGAGANFWRCGGGASGLHLRSMVYTASTNTITDLSATLNGLHLPADVAGAGGYSALQIIRMTRANGTATAIKMNIQPGVVNDVAYSSTPTIAAIRALLRSSVFTESAGVNVAAVPDAIYARWPFFLSRLRIHALALERFA